MGEGWRDWCFKCGKEITAPTDIDLGHHLTWHLRNDCPGFFAKLSPRVSLRSNSNLREEDMKRGRLIMNVFEKCMLSNKEESKCVVCQEKQNFRSRDCYVKRQSWGGSLEVENYCLEEYVEYKPEVWF